MSSEKNPSLFHLTFIGEYVEILTCFYQKHIEGNQDSISEQTVPIVIQGYILDIDDEFYYIGNNPSEVVRAIRKQDARAFEILQPKNVFDEILEHMPVPENKDSEN